MTTQANERLNLKPRAIAVLVLLGNSGTRLADINIARRMGEKVAEIRHLLADMHELGLIDNQDMYGYWTITWKGQGYV